MFLGSRLMFSASSNIQILLPLLAASLCLFWAAYSDIQQFRIPNQVSVLIAGLFFLFLFVNPNENFTWAAPAAALAVLCAGFALFTMGIVGAGDVKLLSALALWAGAENIAFLLVVATIAGAIVALTVSLSGAFTAYASGERVTRNLLFKRPIPYGVAIACGGLALYGRQAAGLLT
jgi:prepilin peptidase CpaA